MMKPGHLATGGDLQLPKTPARNQKISDRVRSHKAFAELPPPVLNWIAPKAKP